MKDVIVYRSENSANRVCNERRSNQEWFQQHISHESDEPNDSAPFRYDLLPIWRWSLRIGIPIPQSIIEIPKVSLIQGFWIHDSFLPFLLIVRLSNMPRPDSKVMLQPIDVIFRALQSISFFEFHLHSHRLCIGLEVLNWSTRRVFRFGSLTRQIFESRDKLR